MPKAAAPRSPSHHEALFDTVERLRREHFSRLDAELVREVLHMHASGAAPTAETVRRVEALLERHLAGTR